MFTARLSSLSAIFYFRTFPLFYINFFRSPIAFIYINTSLIGNRIISFSSSSSCTFQSLSDFAPFQCAKTTIQQLATNLSCIHHHEHSLETELLRLFSLDWHQNNSLSQLGIIYRINLFLALYNIYFDSSWAVWWPSYSTLTHYITS